jgi:hypothetical protein
VGFFSGTYESIKNIYEIAIKNRFIKRNDKDTYLLKKFMNNENRLFCKGFLGSFLIDLEISKIYQIITSSKPPQRLTPQTVDNLIAKCIVDSHQFI